MRTSSGLTPAIRWTESEVVVTFSVATRPPRAATCQGNEQVPYEVDLGERLEHRALVDGHCLPGREAATTSFCMTDSVRFKP
jgi:hypothetical protein